MDLRYTHMSEDDLRGGPGAHRCVGGANGEGQAAKGAKRARMAKPSRARESRPRKRPTVKAAQRRTRHWQKAATWDSLQALSKLGEVVDGHYRIKSQPPVVVRLREIGEARRFSAERSNSIVREQFRENRSTLQDDRKHLLERFEIIDVARKVVGVGSVGTRGFDRPAAGS